MGATSTEQTAAAYTAVAATYDQLLSDTRFEPAADLAWIQRLVAEVGIGRGADLLDAGCGAGRMLTHLNALDPSLRLAGVDLAEGMVDRARVHHPRLQIEIGDLANLPFEDAAFDGVLAWYSIIHTREIDLPQIISECGRMLRPDGSLLLGFHAGCGERMTHRVYGHDVGLTVQLHGVDRVAELLCARGFAVQTRAERPARSTEKNSQGFVLAHRHPAIAE